FVDSKHLNFVNLASLSVIAFLLASTGAFNAYAQCAPDNGGDGGDGGDGGTDQEASSTDRQDYDDGRCKDHGGLVSGQERYCGGSQSASAATKEYTFAQLWSGIKTVLGSPDTTYPQSEPVIMLATFHGEQATTTEEAAPAASTHAASKEEVDDFYVQLAALSSESAAREYWDNLPSAVSAMTYGIDAHFQPILTMPSKDTLYAVHTGPFDGEDAARGWCADLLVADVDCFVVHPNK
ncbi:MAG: SPOR domain-containing protein, partial [Pseudomonadota bacterium]